jgi:uncharacterized protein YbjQ (UPF0145 family)
MIVSTTNIIEGKRITEYLGLVTGEAIVGANVIRDIMATARDVFGGRAGAYEQELRKAREAALGEMQEEAQQLGATAIVGVDIDYESIRGSMLMVTLSGTAVKLVDA